ncbi:hypothetical protein ACTHGU_07385 [Chitinophagaceae bacterium MMS25-I14]
MDIRPVPEDVPEKVFRYSAWPEFIMGGVFMLLMLLGFWSGSNANDAVLWLFEIIAALYIISRFWWAKRQKPITLSADSITIPTGTHYWRDILDTAILYSPQGRRYSKTYLIIVFQDNTYLKYGINGYASAKQMAAYIEYFKAKAALYRM